MSSICFRRDSFESADFHPQAYLDLSEMPPRNAHSRINGSWSWQGVSWQFGVTRARGWRAILIGRAFDFPIIGREILRNRPEQRRRGRARGLPVSLVARLSNSAVTRCGCRPLRPAHDAGGPLVPPL
jgi:hypothetical protein